MRVGQDLWLRDCLSLYRRAAGGLDLVRHGVHERRAGAGAESAAVTCTDLPSRVLAFNTGRWGRLNGRVRSP